MDMEPNQPLLDQALELMLAGMGTVFGFLIMLVFATRAMSWLVLRVQRPQAVDAQSSTAQSAISAEELAAAAAAVHRYRQDH